MVVCGGRGRQAAGVGGVRGLAGRGGVIYQSEQIRVEFRSGTEHEPHYSSTFQVRHT